MCLRMLSCFVSLCNERSSWKTCRTAFFVQPQPQVPEPRTDEENGGDEDDDDDIKVIPDITVKEEGLDEQNWEDEPEPDLAQIIDQPGTSHEASGYVSSKSYKSFSPNGE